MFNDKQELRRVAEILSQCSGPQIVSVLREAHLGVNKQRDGRYVVDLRSEDEIDAARDWDDEDENSEDDAWS